MDLFDTTQLALSRAMQGASQRQTVLAENIANVNTPGYRRQDVDFHDSLRAALAGGASSIESVAFSPQVDQASVVRADGNSVDMDVEASRLAQNGLEYESLAQVAKARLDILRSAIGGQ
jgi:flagellar basal-body rod protein FlgB